MTSHPHVRSPRQQDSVRLRRDAAWAFKVWRRLYGPITFRPGGDPLDALIQTVLSQNTSDVNSDRSFRSLKSTFPTWTSVLTAPTRSIAGAIRSGGLANIKAPRIKAILREILQREGKLDLERLRGVKTSEALGYLTMLPGVGMKTASCVLLFSLGRPVMPVDTHVHRVTRRLGWAPWKTPPEKVQLILERIIPARRILATHLYLVRHGRTLCKAARPRCNHCPLCPRCRFGKSSVEESRSHG